MKRLIAIPVLIVCSLAASAQTLTGVVTNGTTHKPAGGDDVILLKLAQGMQEEARTKTDAQGHFSLSLPNAQSPHLLRVRHQNVNYHEPVMPGKNNLQIVVYNAVNNVPGLKIVDDSQVFQAEQNALKGIEVFRVRNDSTPPVTQPTFDFYLPEGAKIEPGRAEVLSPGGMPINSAPVPQKEKNKYSFVYPVRPGITQFELVYSMPYQGSLKVTPKTTIPVEKLYVVTPRSVKFEAAGGSPFHEDQWVLEPQMDVSTHSVESLNPGQEVAFTISGAGRLPQDNPQPQQAGSANGREDARPGGGLGVPNEKPNPLSSGQWAFLGVLVLFLAGGAAFLFLAHKSMPVAATAAGPNSMLEALKDEMFQLESERAQGKMSPGEYDAAKKALDKLLQRAIKANKRAVAR